MKRVLLIKTSSLGDLIHTWPALTDAMRAIPGITFDWVVEESFAAIPPLHPAVDRVIPVALRRWRKHKWTALRSGEIRKQIRTIRERRYDMVLDAQALFKSAWLAPFAHGPRYGLDRQSAREGIASFFYQHKLTVNFKQHAIVRMRQLFAKALGYTLPDTASDFSVHIPATAQYPAPYAVFLHGTTWATKHYPDGYWQQLGKMVKAAGWQVLLPWGNAIEQQRAEAIAKACGGAVLPKSSLTELASILKGAKAVVAVDTGLAHLAAALDVPTITLYGATNPGFTGTVGKHALNVSAEFACAPCLNRQCTYRGASEMKPACYETLPPAKVWQAVQGLLANVAA